jgi:hypothetical protein
MGALLNDVDFPKSEENVSLLFLLLGVDHAREFCAGANSTSSTGKFPHSFRSNMNMNMMMVVVVFRDDEDCQMYTVEALSL